MPATLEDIAKRVGKSITTVSRALHDYDDVSPKTKAMVRQAADEMGYTPSSTAQRLQKRRSDTIGMVLPTFGPRFADPFFSELIAGVGNQAAKMGYDLLVSTRPPGELELQTYRLNIQSGRVDGFIIVRTRRVDERVNFLRERNYPFVAFGRTEGNDDFPYVDEDSRQGTYLISKHLLELGHTRIGCISGPPELNFSNQRLEGIKSALVEYGLEYDPTLCRQSDMTQSGGYINAEELLSLDPHPTAIIACNDLMAFGAMSAAYKSGFIVGQDISITGFDDIPMSEHSHPPLTTVNQPIYEIGEMVCEMLIRLILGQELEHSQIILKPKLVVRQSTGENQR